MNSVSNTVKLYSRPNSVRPHPSHEKTLRESPSREELIPIKSNLNNLCEQLVGLQYIYLMFHVNNLWMKIILFDSVSSP